MTETSTYYIAQEPIRIVDGDSMLSQDEALFLASVRMLLNNQLMQPAAESVECILGFSRSLR